MVVASVDGMKYKLINKKIWPKLLIHKWLFSVFYYWHQILYSTRHTEIIQSISIGFQLFIAIFFHLVYKELQEGAVREKDTIFYCSILLTWFIILYYIILFYQKLIFWMYFVFYIEIWLNHSQWRQTRWCHCSTCTTTFMPSPKFYSIKWGENSRKIPVPVL